MRQIDREDLRFVVEFELGQLGNATLRDMASGHDATRRRAIRMGADHLLSRMIAWEIIVPDRVGADGALPLFGSDTPEKRP